MGEFDCWLQPANGFRDTCERPFGETVQINLEPGNYVVGVPEHPGARYRAMPPAQPAIECVHTTAVLEVVEASLIPVEVWTASDEPGPFSIRDIDMLCPVPANCCVDSGSDAAKACDDEGLRACVIDGNPTCANEWNTPCVALAMFRCGANCT